MHASLFFTGSQKPGELEEIKIEFPRIELTFILILSESKALGIASIELHLVDRQLFKNTRRGLQSQPGGQLVLETTDILQVGVTVTITSLDPEMSEAETLRVKYATSIFFGGSRVV